MNWFILALIAPVLWSIVNQTDKYLISHRLKGAGVQAVFTFSALFSIVVIPVALFYTHSSIFTLPTHQIIILLISGCVGAVAFYFYLKSIEHEDISLAVTLFQLNPVWGYFLGLLILKETLSSQQIFASLIIIFGVFIVSLDFEELKLRRISMKARLLMFSVMSSFLFALQDTVFKAIAIHDAFWFSNFWQYLGLFLTGVFVIVFSPKFRNSFKLLVNRNNGTAFRFVTMGEILFLVGNIMSNYAMLFAPVALVLVVNSYQPLFVFITSLIIARLWPHLPRERLSHGHIAHKVLSIAIVLFGSYLLYFAK